MSAVLSLGSRARLLLYAATRWEKIPIGRNFNSNRGNFFPYRRIFPIIGESLAAVRSGLWWGGLFDIFIAEYAMKPRFFLNNFVFVLMHFRVFLRDQPYKVVILQRTEAGLTQSVNPALPRD